MPLYPSRWSASTTGKIVFPNLKMKQTKVSIFRPIAISLIILCIIPWRKELILFHLVSKIQEMQRWHLPWTKDNESVKKSTFKIWSRRSDKRASKELKMHKNQWRKRKITKLRNPKSYSTKHHPMKWSRIKNLHKDKKWIL